MLRSERLTKSLMVIVEAKQRSNKKSQASLINDVTDVGRPSVREKSCGILPIPIKRPIDGTRVLALLNQPVQVETGLP